MSGQVAQTTIHVLVLPDASEQKEEKEKQHVRYRVFRAARVPTLNCYHYHAGPSSILVVSQVLLLLPLQGIIVKRNLPIPPTRSHYNCYDRLRSHRYTFTGPTTIEVTFLPIAWQKISERAPRYYAATSRQKKAPSTCESSKVGRSESISETGRRE